MNKPDFKAIDESREKAYLLLFNFARDLPDFKLNSVDWDVLVSIIADKFRKEYEQGRRDENEACAKIAEETANFAKNTQKHLDSKDRCATHWVCGKEIAKAIRNRRKG